MNKLKHICKLLCTVALALSAPCAGQGHSSSWYTTENGLPQNSVKDIVKDRYGFLWLSTENGILRYDGNSFQSYGELGVKNLHFKTFRGSVGKDLLYIFNNEDKDCVAVGGRRPAVMAADPSMRDEECFEGHIYTRYAKRNITEPTVEGRYFVELPTGRYYLGMNKVLYRANGSTTVQRLSVPFDPAETGNVFAMGETLFIPDRREGCVIKIDKGVVSEEPNSLVLDNASLIYWEQVNGQMLVVNRDVIYTGLYRNGRLTFRKIFAYKDFGNHQFYCMYYDPAYGTLYLGSLIKGLNVLRSHDLSVVKKNIPFREDQFYTAVPLGDDRVMTPDGYVYNERGVVERYPLGDGNMKHTMVHDDQMDIACISSHGLHRYGAASHYRNVRTTPKTLLLENMFRCGSHYFVSQRNKGVHELVMYGNMELDVPEHTFGFGSTINCMAPFSGDGILVGTQDGLYLVDTRTRRSTPFSPSSRKLGVKNICRTRDGRLWVLTYSEGFFLLQGERLVKMPLDRDGQLASSHHLMEDRAGDLWITTNNGLYRVPKSILLRYAEHRDTPVGYYRYSTYNGLETNEFNGNGIPGALALRNGSFVFPSMIGLVFLRPELVARHYPQRDQVFVERVRTDGDGAATQYFNNSVTLERSFGKAEFYIDLPYFSDNVNLTVEARIKGGGQPWTKVGNTRSYTPDGMGSGDNTLQVRVLTDAFGHYYYKDVHVYVVPSFYETEWFIALCVAGMVASVAVIIWYRTRDLRGMVSDKELKIRSVKKDLVLSEEKLKTESDHQEQLFQAITHDIATPIKHLSNLSQMIAETDDPDLQKRYFNSVYRSTEELYKMTMNMKEYRNAFSSEPFDGKGCLVHDVVDEKIRLFGELAKHHNTRLINNIPEDTHIGINRSVLSIIFQNVLDNALKNTLSGSVTFGSAEANAYLEITVSDTGKGMSEDQLAYYNGLYSANDDKASSQNAGLGMHLVIRLVKRIGSRVEFLPNTPTGTTIIIKLKRYVQKNTDS